MEVVVEDVMTASWLCVALLACPVSCCRILDSAKRKPVVEAEQVNNAADLYARLGAEVEAMANRLQDHVRPVGVGVVLTRV